MTFDEYQEAAARTLLVPGRTLDQSVAILSMGLAGEVGEVIEPLKKHIGHGRALDLLALQAELGDVLWYLAGLATTLGLSLNDAAAGNIGKLRARYPNGFVPERSP